MKFSLNNNISNLENVHSKFIFCRRRHWQEGNEIRKNRITRKRTIKPWGLEAQSRALSSDAPRSLSPSSTPLQSSLNEVQVNDVDQGELSPELENMKGSQMQQIINMVLSGNKDKIQNITTKEEFFNAIKELKNLGEKIFDSNDESTSTDENVNEPILNAMVENHQLATPISTPMDSAFLDESVLSGSLSQNKMDNDLSTILPNLALDSNINVIPSPEIFSPIQQTMNGTPFMQTPFEKPEDLIAATTPFIQSTPFMQSTPFDKPEDIFAVAPFMQSTPFEEVISTPFIQPTPFDKPIDVISTPIIGLQDTSIVSQDEINPFKTPAPVLGQNGIVDPSSIVSGITSPIEEILNQEVASPIESLEDINNNVQSITDILGELTGEPLTNSVINPIQDTPFQPSNNSFLLTPSPSIQADNTTTPLVQASPFMFPPETTPILSPEDLNINDINKDLLADCTSSILVGTNLLGDNTSNEDSSTVLTDDKEKENTDLAKVNDILLEVLSKITSEEELNKNSTNENFGDCTFPSESVIKNCQVKENEFDFTNENISKLVRLAPVEVVREDVLELEKLSKLKRGKGRPRKPRKFSICPFACCQKKFNREFNLKEHIRIHNPSRSKEFICKICNECFFSSSVLSRHVASIHEGEKFFCKHCGKSFNRKDALHRHEKTSCQKIQNSY